MSFLEIYKRVDNFCKDAFNSDKGISTYIEELDELKFEQWYGIQWQNTYNKLKNYRYIRNQIAHEINASEDKLCSSEDILWLEGFYNDLLNCDDPLSKRQQKINESSKNNTNVIQLDNNVEPKPAPSEKTTIFDKIKTFFKNLFS